MTREDHRQGFISLHRTILDWEWYGDVNTCRLFIHLLLTANYESRRVRGVTVKRGQVSTTVRKLAEETSLTPQKVRTALNHLKSTHEITCSANPKGIAITIKNYEKYQTVTHSVTSNTRKKINTPTNEQHTLGTDCGAMDCADDVMGDNTVGNKRLTNDQRTTSNKEINIPPISPKGDGYDSDFLAFWDAYPKGRKKAKGAAWRAWKKLRPDAALQEAMLAAVAAQAESADWRRDGGQYIPYPATWLNQRRWEDEIEERTRDDDEGII